MKKKVPPTCTVAMEAPSTSRAGAQRLASGAALALKKACVTGELRASMGRLRPEGVVLLVALVELVELSVGAGGSGSWRGMRRGRRTSVERGTRLGGAEEQPESRCWKRSLRLGKEVLQWLQVDALPAVNLSPRGMGEGDESTGTMAEAERVEMVLVEMVVTAVEASGGAAPPVVAERATVAGVDNEAPLFALGFAKLWSEGGDGEAPEAMAVVL